MLIAIGESIGVLGALAFGAVMSTMLFRVGSADPLTYSLASLTWGGVAAIACYLPARRATGIEPVAVLRRE